jgi:large subunit ribosomal protein L5
MAEEKAKTPSAEETVPEDKTAEAAAFVNELKAELKKPKAAPAKKKVATKEAESKPVEAADTPIAQEETTEPAVEAVVPKVVKPVHKEWAANPMLVPVIEKVTVNMSVGKSGAPLEQAVTILKQLTKQKPSRRVAKKTVREFGIRKGESIACVVTLRDEPAKEFLKKAFVAVEKKLSKYSFDKQGNFSFGIKEHIDIPGTKYAPELGIHGMDVSVSLGRAGYRVKRRHRVRTNVGKDHLLTSQEAILFIKDEFDVEII